VNLDLENLMRRELKVNLSVSFILHESHEERIESQAREICLQLESHEERIERPRLPAPSSVQNLMRRELKELREAPSIVLTNLMRRELKVHVRPLLEPRPGIS
jgi:hypothetical protein